MSVLPYATDFMMMRMPLIGESKQKAKYDPKQVPFYGNEDEDEDDD